MADSVLFSFYARFMFFLARKMTFKWPLGRTVEQEREPQNQLASYAENKVVLEKKYAS